MFLYLATNLISAFTFHAVPTVALVRLNFMARRGCVPPYRKPNEAELVGPKEALLTA